MNSSLVSRRNEGGYFLIHCIQTKITLYIFPQLLQYRFDKVDKEKDEQVVLDVVLVSLARLSQTIMRSMQITVTIMLYCITIVHHSLIGLGLAFCPKMKLSRCDFQLCFKAFHTLLATIARFFPVSFSAQQQALPLSEKDSDIHFAIYSDEWSCWLLIGLGGGRPLYTN